MLGRRLGAGVDGQGQNGHLGYLLQHHRVMHGVHGVCTPCERAMAVDEHGGSIICLPNKVVIEGENTAEDSESSPKIDAVT